jgi:hypothetical protein
MQHSDVASAEHLRLFPESADLAEQATAVDQQVFAGPGELESATHSVEEPDTEFLFQIRDLSRQRRLRDMQALGGSRHGADFRDGHERTHMAEVHRISPDAVAA